MHLCERLVSISNDCLLADLRLLRLSTDSQSNEASVKSLNKKTKRKKKLRKAKQSYNNTNSKQKKSISWKVERLLSLIYSCGWPPLSKVLCLRVTSGSGLTFLLKVRCREFYDKLNEWRTHWFLFVISGRTDIYMTSPSTSISFVIIKKKNTLHFAVGLHSNRSRQTSNYGNNITDKLGCAFLCHFFILSTF